MLRLSGCLLIAILGGADALASTRPARIVTLTPAVAELCADFLETDLDRIVGVSSYTDYPPALAHKPVIANHAEIYYERLLALKPDLVIASKDGQPRRVIDRLKTFGIRVEEIETFTLAGVGDSFEKVGSWLGQAEKGKKFANEFKAELEGLKKASSSRATSPSVAIVVGYKPWVVVGKPGFIHSVLDLLGAKNAFADARSPYPRISEEELLRRNPDFVIFLARGFKPERWKSIPGLRAIKANHVLSLEADALLRPSRRLKLGIRKLAEVLNRP